MCTQLLRRFHRDESAQLSFLGVAGAVCFIALLSMIINTEDVIGERVHMQDVADATALSAAAWTARGLNTISFVNVLNTKLVSAAVLINALADTIPVTIAVGQIQQAIFNACTGVPIVGAFCGAMAVVVTIQLRALDVLKKIVDRMANTLSKCKGGSAVLWKVTKALQKLADGVRSTFGAIGIAESISIAKANGADFGIVLNGKLTDVKGQLTLPVKDVDFEAHCPYMKNGGPGFELQSYQCSQGPLKIGRERINKTLLVPFINLAAHPIFAGMVTKHMTQLGCTPEPGEENTKIPVTLKDLDQCSKYDASGRWSHIWAESLELTAAEADQYSMNDFIPWRPVNEDHSTSETPTDKNKITSQLGQLGLPTDGSGGAGDSEMPLGKGMALIPKEKESRRDIYLYNGIRYDQISCRGARYPFYVPPSPTPDYDWASRRPGTAYSQPCIYCRPIKEWGKFTWVSGNHVINGPETAGGYFIRVDKRTIDPEEEDAEPTYRFVVETITLVDAGKKEMSQEEFKKYLEEEGQKGVNTDGTQSSTGCDKPRPFVLDKGTDFQDRLRFIGVVWKETDDEPPFWSNFFEDPPPVIIAYAQAQVYNYLSEDTFTQDWRVRLEQATLLEGLVRSGKGGAMGKPGFAGAVIGEVNNH